MTCRNGVKWIALALWAFAAAPASATLLDFEGFDNKTALPNGYGGLNWSNMYAINGLNYAQGNSGYRHGVVSGSNVAFNAWADMAVTSSSGLDFDFNGAYLTGAWNDGLNIKVEGFNDGVLLYTQTVIASWYAATYFTFDFMGIDTLQFTSYGGTPVIADGKHFAMDNFRFNEAPTNIPEPGTMSLIGLGLVGLASLHRRRSRR